MDNAEGVEEALARQIRPLVDHELTMVFYGHLDFSNFPPLRTDLAA
jgi:hypothetical protein